MNERFSSAYGKAHTPAMAGDRALTTPLTRTLGIDFPLIQAPIGRVSGPELVAAVSNAGALGMLGVSWTDPEVVRSAIGRTARMTDRPFGVNLGLRWDQHMRLKISLEEDVRLVSLFWADREPIDSYVDEAHAAGALVMHTIGTAEEARRAVDSGVDVIVAQGAEAGGHVWGSIGTLVLVPTVVDAVSPTPVIAAGGIGDGRGLAAVLVLGAQAAWMGTRFVVADEGPSDPAYRDRIVQASETDAVLSSGVFDRGFEDAPVRTLDNSTLRRWREAGSPEAGRRPGEDDVVAHREDGSPILRYATNPPTLGLQGDLEAMGNYAGQSAGLVHRRQPAAAIVREVVAEASRALVGVTHST
jgi:nitronate monooxygenase